MKGELESKKKQSMKKLNKTYRVKRKGLKFVIEELKQRMLTKNAKPKRYEQNIEQFRQNRTFALSQYNTKTGMGLYRMMCQMQKNAQSFRAIFGVSQKSIKEAEWLKDLKREREREEMTNVLKKE